MHQTCKPSGRVLFLRNDFKTFRTLHLLQRFFFSITLLLYHKFTCLSSYDSTNTRIINIIVYKHPSANRNMASVSSASSSKRLGIWNSSALCDGIVALCYRPRKLILSGTVWVHEGEYIPLFGGNLRQKGFQEISLKLFGNPFSITHIQLHLASPATGLCGVLFRHTLPPESVVHFMLIYTSVFPQYTHTAVH